MRVCCTRSTCWLIVDSVWMVLLKLVLDFGILGHGACWISVFRDEALARTLGSVNNQ